MITVEEAKKGTTVIYNGKETTIISEPFSIGGEMAVKTSSHPTNGLYLRTLTLKVEEAPEAAPAEEVVAEVIETGVSTQVEVKPKAGVTFEAQILDETEPIELTPELIKAKSAPLLALTINGIADDKGYKAVKAAKNKAVKTRTSIEKLEKDKTGELKKWHDEAKKQITDVAKELYEACREVEDNLNKKITAIDTAKAAALKAEEEKQKGREDKMYSLGMNWNGQYFTGYGKIVVKETLFNMTDEQYGELLEELDLLEAQASMSDTPASVTPVPAPQATQGNLATSFGGTGMGRASAPAGRPSTPALSEPPAIDAIYERAAPEAGVRVFITTGMLDATLYPDSVIINDRIGKSDKYFHMLR